MSDDTVPHPPGIHPECLVNPNLCHRWGEVVSVYDPDTKVGGLFSEVTRQWLLYFPVELDEFAARTVRAVDFLLEQASRTPPEKRH